MLLNSNTEFVIINPLNKETFYFNGKISELKKINKEGNNIYYILNDFNSQRTINDLVGFKRIGIDLDMKKNNTNEPFGGSISEVLISCNEKLGFLPTKINRTYKGFHIFFKLSSDLYSLDKEQYVKLYKYINEQLGGDSKMKDITGILKVEGFIDNKEGRKNFIIKNEFFDIKNEINVKIVEKILKEPVKFDTKRIEEFQNKILKKNRNNNMLEDIDSLDFINAINNNKDVFNGVYIEIKNNTIDNTNGLKIYNDNGIYRIKDFSGKNRFGNRLFLYNYVIKEKMGITDFKDERIGKIIGWLSKEFGIKYNKSLIKEPISNSYIEQVFRKNQMKIDDDLYKEISNKKIVETFNSIIMNSYDKGMMLKIIVGLQKYEQDYKLNFFYGGMVDEVKFLEMLNLSNDTKNKEKIRKYLLVLSYIKMEVYFEKDIGNNNIIKGLEYKNIYEYGIGKDKLGKVYYKIKMNIKPKKKIFLPPQILKIKQGNHFNLTYTITTGIEEFKTITIPMEEIYSKLETKNSKTIKEFCEKIKSEDIIKGYEINNSNIKFW